MNRYDLEKAVAAKCKLSQAVVRAVIDAMALDAVAQARAGLKAHWPFFGTFYAQHYTARNGWHPKLQKPIVIAPRSLLRWVPSNHVKRKARGL